MAAKVFFNEDFRSDNRYDVDLTCRLQTLDLEVSAKITNLSLGGAGINCNSAIMDRLRDLKCVVIPSVGTFSAEIRWRGGDHLGVSFTGQTARGKLKRYLAELSLDAVSKANF